VLTTSFGLSLPLSRPV